MDFIRYFFLRIAAIARAAAPKTAAIAAGSGTAENDTVSVLPAHSKSANPFARFFAEKYSSASVSGEKPSKAWAVMSSKTVPSSMNTDGSKPAKSTPIFPSPAFENVPSIFITSGDPPFNASAL